MTSIVSDAAGATYACTLAEFKALTDRPADSETLANAAMQAIVLTLGVDRCHVFRRGHEPSSTVLVTSTGDDGTPTGREPHALAAQTLNQYDSGLLPPPLVDGSLSVVIEGDSTAFGVCVCHRDSAAFTSDEVDFVRSIVEALTDTFRRAHAERDRARLSAVIASADDAIIEVTKEGRIFNWNAAAEALLGYRRGDVIGLSVTTLLDEDHVSEAFSIMAAVSRGATVRCRETRFRKSDGSPLDVLVRAVPIVLPGQRITAATLSVRDAGERREAEKKLHVQGDILAQMPAAIMVWRLDDPDDSASLRLVLANREASAAAGSSLDEDLGARFDEVTFNPAAVVGSGVYANVVRTGVPRDLGEHCASRDIDVRHWYHVQALPLPDACVAVVFQDVTERRALTGQLQHAQRMEIIGRLAGGVAHDFNNILTIIRGYGDLLRMKGGESASATRYLDEIDRATDSAQQLTRQLLAFSRRQTLNPVTLDLAAVLKSTRGMLQRLIGDDIQLSVSGDEPVKVVADPGQMEQVLLNLAVNARDAMPAGGKLVVESSVVQVRQETCEDPMDGDPPQPPDGAYGVLTVTDTGLGMDPATVTQIFEPFFTTKDSGKGTGLGLSTVHGIVKQSGGHITVRSTPGKGTSFRIYLPLTRGNVVAFQAKAPVRRTAGQVSGPARWRTVLLVEDDDPLRYLVRTLLTRSGFIVLEAGNPSEAFDALEAFSGTVDLLLSDVVMPCQSGPELAATLVVRFPEMQTVYMSGYMPNSSGYRKLPPDARFLQKPFSPDELMAVVNDSLPVEP